MQAKTDTMAERSVKVGLHVNRGKTKVMRVNNQSQEPISVYGEPIEEVDFFIYLGSVVDKLGGTDADIKARKGKARSAFKKMKNVWSSAMLSTRIKVRIFNSTIKPVLMYGSETWRMNSTPINKVQSFVNSCLRKLLRIHSEVIIDLPRIVGEDQPVKKDITQRKWRWMGHTLRKPDGCKTR